MPYKSDGLKLSENQDRRRKLTTNQKMEIVDLYQTGDYTTKKLGKMYGVSRSTIEIVVNPERARKVSQRIKEHWRDYLPSKEKKAAITREHRRYKRELFLKGELSDNETTVS